MSKERAQQGKFSRLGLVAFLDQHETALREICTESPLLIKAEVAKYAQAILTGALNAAEFDSTIDRLMRRAGAHAVLRWLLSENLEDTGDSEEQR